MDHSLHFTWHPQTGSMLPGERPRNEEPMDPLAGLTGNYTIMRDPAAARPDPMRWYYADLLSPPPLQRYEHDNVRSDPEGPFLQGYRQRNQTVNNGLALPLEHGVRDHSVRLGEMVEGLVRAGTDWVRPRGGGEGGGGPGTVAFRPQRQYYRAPPEPFVAPHEHGLMRIWVGEERGEGPDGTWERERAAHFLWGRRWWWRTGCCSSSS